MTVPRRVLVDRTLPNETSVRETLVAHTVTSLGEDEELARLHRVFYPTFRVQVAYREDAGFLRRGESRTRTVLLDGLWAENHEHLTRYADTSVDATSIVPSSYDLGTDHDGLGRSVLFEFQTTNERAARLIPDRIEEAKQLRDGPAGSVRSSGYFEVFRRSFGLPDSFDLGDFRGVVDLARVYLPFWVAEFHAPDTDRAILYAFRDLGDAVPPQHTWLSRFLSEDPMRVARYGHRVAVPDRDEDGSDEASSAEDTTRTPTRRSGDGPPASNTGESPPPDTGAAPLDGPAVVQPEGVEMNAESLVDAGIDRSFADVGGMADLKQTLRHKVLGPVEDPATYEEYGVGVVNGVLLHGPPGCGKTYIAGALAGELGVNFVSVTPADLTSKYMGEPAQKVKELFAIARANAPCVLFLDEIDAVAGARDDGQNTSEGQMVNQLLTELEGIAEDDVVVVGATNLVEDVDGAIRRSGRFDERVEVPPPDAPARREMLTLHLAGRPLEAALSLDETVAETAGFAASDLELAVENAARAALLDSDPIGETHLLAAVAETGTSIPDWTGPDDGDGVVQPDGVSLSARTLVDPAPDRTFADVGGMADLKRTLESTVVDPLENPERYEEYGLDVLAGLLLHGPPGCGKTYVAGALAGEVGYSFLPVSPADVTSKWMGEPAKNVRDLFAIARANAPCVLFVDEIDAIAGDRSNRMNASEQQMVNQLLTELEQVAGTGVVVVGATNLVEDVDPAIRRSGRFDERVEVPPPDANARREVLQVHLDGRPVADDVVWKDVVADTKGYAASDLALVAENAARKAMRADVPVDTDHLLAAVAESHSSIDDWEEGRRERNRDLFTVG